jgi:hypothetical protein
VADTGDPTKISADQAKVIDEMIKKGQEYKKILDSWGASVADYVAKQAEMAKNQELSADALAKEILRLDEKIIAEQKIIDKYKEQKKSREWEISFNEQQIDHLNDQIRLVNRRLLQNGDLAEWAHAQTKQLEKQKELLKIKNRENSKYVTSMEEAVGHAKDLATSMGGLFQAYDKSPLFNVENIVKFSRSLAGGTNSAREMFNTLASVGLSSFINATIGAALAADKAEVAFRRTSGASKALARTMTDSYKATREMGVTMEQAGQTISSLHSKFTDFTMVTKRAATEIQNTGNLMQRLGVSSDSYATALQIGNKVLGQTGEQAASTTLELTSLAANIGVAPAQMINDFGAARDSVAKLGADGVRAFKDLARVSKITGLEVTKLLAITDKFDTFEGAATQAGKLNAALGGNFVNAMDLMTATDPVERFEMIRGAIEEAGLSFDTMSYYQKKFYADSLGLDSVGDLANMMSGDMSALGNEMNMTSADYAEQADRAREMQDVMEKLKTLMRSLIPVFTPLIDALTSMADHMSRNIGFYKGAVTVIGSLILLYKGARVAMMAWAAVVGIANGLAAITSFFRTKETVELAANTTVQGTNAAAKGVNTVATGALGTASGLAAGPMLAFGFAALMVGGAIALAAVGIAMAANSFVLLLGAVDIESVSLVITLMLAIGVFGWTGAGLLAGVGFAAMAAGLFLLAGSLALISTKDLEAIATFSESLSNSSAGQLLETARAIRVVAKAMDEVPVWSARTLTTVLNHVSTTSAQSSAGGVAGANRSATAGSGAASGGSSQSRSGGKQQVTVNLSIDKTVFETKVLDIVDGAITVQGG